MVFCIMGFNENFKGVHRTSWDFIGAHVFFFLNGNFIGVHGFFQWEFHWISRDFNGKFIGFFHEILWDVMDSYGDSM